jgi:hypothetical protein
LRKLAPRGVWLSLIRGAPTHQRSKQSSASPLFAHCRPEAAVVMTNLSAWPCPAEPSCLCAPSERFNHRRVDLVSNEDWRAWVCKGNESRRRLIDCVSQTAGCARIRAARTWRQVVWTNGLDQRRLSHPRRACGSPMGKLALKALRRCRDYRIRRDDGVI